MRGTITETGHRLALEALIKSGLTLRLFVNNREPNVEDTRGAFVEASMPGYAPRALSRLPNKWTWNLDPKEGVLTATPLKEEFMFTHGVGQTIYGWFLTIDDQLYGVSKLRKKFEIDSIGDTLTVIPVLSQKLRSE